MADITARLIWYRLGESYANMVESCESFLEWYEHFSWRRVDFLDMLFLGWLIAAFLVVGLINLYLRFFGLPGSRKRGLWGDPGKSALGPGGVPLGPGETCQWINSLFSWLFLHYHHTPEFVDCWLRALNEEARKQQHSQDPQMKFDKIQAGSLPPKFTQVSTEMGPNETLNLNAYIEAQDLTLLVSSLQPSVSSQMKVANCDVVIQKLNGQLRVHSDYTRDEIKITASFLQPPVMTIQVKSRNYERSFDAKMLEGIVRAAIGGAITQIVLPSKGGYPNFYATANAADRFEATSAMNVNAAKMSTTPSSSLRDRRLLVKVIKANSLGDKEFGCTDPFCTVTMDEPPQRHTTSVVKNTVNPFWDEHFLLDLDDTTRNIKFELYDREKPPGDDFLGRAVIEMSELRRMPSSRQIVPLQGRLRNNQPAHGSITLEFLFMEPAEAQMMQLNTNRPDIMDNVSPRRRIDTSRQVTPSGTVITKTTTTTERPRDGRMDASYNAVLGSHNVGSPKLTVTKPTQDRGGYENTNTMPMSDTSPTEEMGRYGDTHSLSTTMSDQREMKKSRSFASAIRKRFSRSKKPRSHSADRASSLRGEHLLKPPSDQMGTLKPDDTYGPDEVPEGAARKTRSHSFSSSLKKIFGKKKKDYPSSRESSISRLSGRAYEYHDPSRTSTAQPSPVVSDRDQSLRQPSSDYNDYPYSTSVPAHTSSHLYDR